MIRQVTVKAWQCAECSWTWLSDSKPKRCPNRACRKLATYEARWAKADESIKRTGAMLDKLVKKNERRAKRKRVKP